MVKKDINAHAFTKSTKQKLRIFRRCFREWLPVFIHNKCIKEIIIYDLFAGSGTDIDDDYGSPLVLLDEALEYYKFICENGKSIRFVFNDNDYDKRVALQTNVEKFLSKKKQKNINDKISYMSECFSRVIENRYFSNSLKSQNIGKFLLLDQYGFKEISDGVFSKLIDSKFTDFIFFISSSFIRRFKNTPAVLKYLNKNRIPFDETKPMDCHRVIADHFRSLVPAKKEYYIHHFTMQSGSNYYGLIFCTSHTYGMEKFLKVCWDEDKKAGEANFNINNDYNVGTLFYSSNQSNKIQKVKSKLEKMVLSGEISTNTAGMKQALHNGCLPKVFIDVIINLKEKGLIIISGEFNMQATKIHCAKEYKITVRQ